MESSEEHAVTSEGPSASGGYLKLATTTTITTTTTTVEGVGERAAEVAAALLEVTRLKAELKEAGIAQEELKAALHARVQEAHNEAQAKLMALDENCLHPLCVAAQVS